MSDPHCRHCSGFGWLPQHAASGWYERDWRLLLDPTVVWQRCPRCHDQADLARLHDSLSLLMMRRLDQEVAQWSQDGVWRVGVLDGVRRVYRWQGIACVCNTVEPRRWLVLSAGGVASELDDQACQRLLAAAGAPPLRVLDA
ncbi:MAG: hypothetical protein ACOCXJ_09360 [Planctomycetota bacterium]